MPAHTSVKAKKKRIIKSRQSLAEKMTGTTMFPIARVKRIIKADKDLDMMSSEATFLISVATVRVCQSLNLQDPQLTAGILHQALYGGGVHEGASREAPHRQLQGHGECCCEVRGV